MTGRLATVLEAAVDEGLLTSAVALDGVGHSEGFLRLGGREPTFTPGGSDLAVDLGTGGGLPGVVLATRTRARWLLVERSDRRCRFLKWAIRELDLEVRVEVVNADARDLARSDCRGQAALVTARAFGPPPVTAEIGAPLLALGGTLVVSEPPTRDGVGSVERWPSAGIDRLGLVDAGRWYSGMFGYQALSCDSATPDRFPRGGPAVASDPVF